MFCQNCGNKIHEGSKFCNICGAKLDEKSVNDPVVSETDVPPAAPASHVPSAKDKRGGKKRGIIAIAALLLVFSTVAAIFFVKTKQYNDAMELLEDGELEDAAEAFEKLGNFKDARGYYLRLTLRKNVIAAGTYHTVAINEDGEVLAVGSNEHGQCETGDWDDIVDISAGLNCTLGLRSNGKVAATMGGDSGAEISGWRDVATVTVGGMYLFGVRDDGTAVSYPGSLVEDWEEDFVDIAAFYHAVGLRSDGTAVARGAKSDGAGDVEDWDDLVSIAVGMNHTVGLRVDGTVVATGQANVNGWCDVEDWDDIVAIAAGDFHTVGLRADGTVVAVGVNHSGQCDVDDWEDIVAIAAGNSHTVGVRSDGTVVAVGDNRYGQCDVSGWTDIRIP